MQPALPGKMANGAVRVVNTTTALSGRAQEIHKSTATLKSGQVVQLNTIMFPGTESRGKEFDKYIPHDFIEDEVANFYQKQSKQFRKMGKSKTEIKELLVKSTPPPVGSQWVNYMNAYMLQLVPNFSLYPFNMPNDICDELPEFVDPKLQRSRQIAEAEEREKSGEKQHVIAGSGVSRISDLAAIHMAEKSDKLLQVDDTQEKRPLINFSPGAVLIPETRDVFLHSSSFYDEDGIFDYYNWMTKKVGVFSPCFLRYNAVTGKILPVHMQPQNSAELFHTVALIEPKDTGIHYMSPKLGFHALYVPHSALALWEWPMHPDKPDGPTHMIQNKKTDEVYYHLTEVGRPHRVLGNIACKTHLHPILSLGNIGKMTDRDRGFIRHETRHDCQILRGRILAPPTLTEKLNQLIVDYGYRSMYWVPESLIADECKQLIRGNPHKLSYLLGARAVVDRFYNQDQFPPCEDSFEWSWSRLYGKAKEAIEFESRFRLEMEMTGSTPPL